MDRGLQSRLAKAKRFWKQRPAPVKPYRTYGITTTGYLAHLESDTWKNLRRRRWRIAKGRCEDCGVAERLDLHHLTYERFGKELVEDVRLVCRGCHDWRHSAKEHHLHRWLKKPKKKTLGCQRIIDDLWVEQNQRFLDAMKGKGKPYRQVRIANHGQPNMGHIVESCACKHCVAMKRRHRVSA